MASRPIFVPSYDEQQWVERIDVEFEWHPGFSVSQKRASIESLHQAAIQNRPGVERVLEISTKSWSRLGVMLSAFNLRMEHPLDPSRPAVLESVFQGSKVFGDQDSQRSLFLEAGDLAEGPHHDLYNVSARDAKRFMKEKGLSGERVMRFEWGSEVWPTEPKTAFYDFLYLRAVKEFFERAAEQSGVDREDEFLDYDAFTDIEFNPKKSLNCQAASCALYVALSRKGILAEALSSRGSFLDIMKDMQS